MKTSKPMQLRVLDKMRENVERDVPLFDGIAYLDEGYYCTDFILNQSDFYNFEFRIKPETITINGVEIPKPLELSKGLDKEASYYIACHSSVFYDTVCIRYLNIHKPKFTYLTKEEAIEASKLLFGIED